MEATIYNKKGESTGKIEISDKVFGVRWNGDLVSQTINSIKYSQRRGTAQAKTRAEVRGGGRKPWKQKGTGQARHGSTRSPIWVGGGTTHGPRNDRNYERKVNQKAKNKALFTILSAKYRDNEIIFIDDLGIANVKTKSAFNLVQTLSKKIKGAEKLAYKNGNRALILTPAKDSNILKSFRNLKATKVEELRNLEPVSAVSYKYILIVDPKVGLKTLEARK